MTEVRITDPETGGQKGQKPERYDLFPFDALDEVARVYGIGAQKYEDDNWLRGYRWRLSAAALLRHVARFMAGEDRDPETGCLHLAHACWHCLTLITFYLRKLGTDDRAPPGKVFIKPEHIAPAVAASRMLVAGDSVRVLKNRADCHNRTGTVVEVDSTDTDRPYKVRFGHDFTEWDWFEASEVELVS